jgi:peptide-methionine (S)-S-oxide reductase
MRPRPRFRTHRSSAALLPFLLMVLGGTDAAGQPRRAQPGEGPPPAPHRVETATLGGGCFWCTEAFFERLRGVERVTSGYAGGSVPDPTYEQVCAGETGHAEVVQVVFDPAAISYRDLLRVFFDLHDPTTLDRQGADVGEQYRSVIFWRTPEQKAAAEETIAALMKRHAYRDPIVTQVVPFTAFYPAEEHHQGYYDRNRNGGYCRVVIGPKLEKLRQRHAALLRPDR